MFAEPDERHHGAHRHAYCQDPAAVFGIEEPEIIVQPAPEGAIPRGSVG